MLFEYIYDYWQECSGLTVEIGFQEAMAVNLLGKQGAMLVPLAGILYTSRFHELVWLSRYISIPREQHRQGIWLSRKQSIYTLLDAERVPLPPLLISRSSRFVSCGLALT